MAHIPIATCRSRPTSISPFDGTTAIILGPGRLRNKNPAGVNRRAVNFNQEFPYHGKSSGSLGYKAPPRRMRRIWNNSRINLIAPQRNFAERVGDQAVEAFVPRRAPRSLVLDIRPKLHSARLKIHDIGHERHSHATLH